MGEWTLVYNSAASFFLAVLVVGVVYILLHQGLATAGNLVLVLMLLTRLSHLFNMIGQMMNMYTRVYGEIQEGLESILVPHEIVDDGKSELVINDSEINFDKVNFPVLAQYKC